MASSASTELPAIHVKQ